MYLKVLHQVLQECDGAHNILDDVIVHAPTKEEHDKRFENVVRVLRTKGLTLNRDRCQFKMSHLKFMGHVLSARGIGPADVKVKAVVDAREPTNAAEVRSPPWCGQFHCAVYSRPSNSICTPLPPYKEWRIICVGAGATAII